MPKKYHFTIFYLIITLITWIIFYLYNNYLTSVSQKCIGPSCLGSGIANAAFIVLFFIFELLMTISCIIVLLMTIFKKQT